MPQRTDQLTFTRFLAALTVVVFHYGKKAFPFTIYPLSGLVPTGNIFVSYFFTLSGFIMAMVYFRPGKPIQPLKYFVNRFARIYPVYLLGLTLTIALNPKLLRDGVAVLLNFSLLQAWLPPYPNTLNYPGWSLSVEAFFYILFPILLWLSYHMSFKFNAWLVGLFWLASLLGHTHFMNTFYKGFPSFSHDVLFYNPLLHLNAFLLGCLGGRWWVEIAPKRPILPALNSILLAVSFVLICLSLLYLKELPKLLGFHLRIALTNGILAPLFLALILALAADTSLISRVFRHPALVLLGDASYSIYILQYPVHTFYKKFIAGYLPDISDTFYFYAYFVLLILISALIFKGIESPLRNLAKRAYEKTFFARQGW